MDRAAFPPNSSSMTEYDIFSERECSESIVLLFLIFITIGTENPM